MVVVMIVIVIVIVMVMVMTRVDLKDESPKRLKKLAHTFSKNFHTRS